MTQAPAGGTRAEVLVETKLHPRAGFGKTTLVAQWLSADARPFAWVSLDPGGDDPAGCGGTSPAPCSGRARSSASRRSCGRSGSADEAIGHAQAAGDVTGAIDLIARHWYGYVDSGRSATVRGWLRSMGDDQIAASPLAAHCAAWIAALTGDQTSVRCWLPVMEAAPDGGPLPDGAGAQLARLDPDRPAAGRPVAGHGAGRAADRPGARRAAAAPGCDVAARDRPGAVPLPEHDQDHTGAIYRKLGVSDRQTAVLKGRDLGFM